MTHDAPLLIGVLAVQGDFAEHAAMLRRAGHEMGQPVEVREVRTPKDLDGLAGLIVPGGESTAIGKLLVAYGLQAACRVLLEACFEKATNLPWDSLKIGFIFDYASQDLC